MDHQIAGAGARTAMTGHFWLDAADAGGHTVFRLPCRISAQVYLADMYALMPGDPLTMTAAAQT